MSLEIGLIIASMVMSAAASAHSAETMRQQGVYQRKLAKAQAEANKKMAEAEVERKKREYTRQRSANYARGGASGTSLISGSFSDKMADQAYEQSLDEQFTLAGIDMDYSDRLAQGDYASWKANNSATNTYMNAGSSLLSSGSRLASK